MNNLVLVNYTLITQS